MLNKIYKICLVSALIISPFLVGAQLLPLRETGFLLRAVQSTITDTLIPIVFTLAVLLFFWGMAKYIWSEGTGKEEGKKIMIWGVIALFVMSSVWGIVYFIRDELNIGSNTQGIIPTIR